MYVCVCVFLFISLSLPLSLFFSIYCGHVMYPDTALLTVEEIMKNCRTIT